MNLTEFLLARIAEDEDAARLCARVYPSPWDVNDRGASASVMADSPNFHTVARLEQEQVPDGALAWLGDALNHIARWDPARVLAECQAKRRIVDEFVQARDSDHGGEMRNYGYEEGLDQAMRLLALPYNDHPDYQQEWTP